MSSVLELKNAWKAALHARDLVVKENDARIREAQAVVDATRKKYEEATLGFVINMSVQTAWDIINGQKVDLVVSANLPSVLLTRLREVGLAE